MKVMIDADEAIKLLEDLYNNGENYNEIIYNMGVGAAISEIRHLKEEAEQKENI